MPDKANGGAKFRDEVEAAFPARPICRAAPTRLTVPVRRPDRSRRSIIIGGTVVAALLAGASVALAATASEPPPAAHSASSHATR
jgi:hypothetical protein